MTGGEGRALWMRALRMLLAMTALTGVAYPLLVTGIARGLMPYRASGSLLVREGQVVGSEWIGQPFSDPRYFWPRPSATRGVPYNPMASGASNLAPTNRDLARAVQERASFWRLHHPQSREPVPVDLLTASASGLDPHISVAAALYQVPRVARARGLDEGSLRALVLRHVEGRTLGFLGEPRVNVLLLNLSLDRLGR